MFGIDFDTTKDIKLPDDPFKRIIGQDEAVMFARLVAKQHRNLLLVGPPGTGKSMIAKAIASILKAPTQEISVIDNPQNPNRPVVQVRNAKDVYAISKPKIGKTLQPEEVPHDIAERLGLRCKRCGATSHYTVIICPVCGAEKYQHANLFSILGLQNLGPTPEFGEKKVVSMLRSDINKKPERVIYERMADGTVKMYREQDIERMERYKRISKRNIIVPLKRSLFVQAGAGSETELLGDVKHDPYGSHPGLGTPPYLRVVPGAVHEAHEGVLYIDELSVLEDIQRYLLTAMQDKHFPIVGRNPTSSGASVRVDNVPCDFILVGAVNIGELDTIMPALRSRIRGDGYEILMKNKMPNTVENRAKFVQFVAQEIDNDGKIPHATKNAVKEMLSYAIRLAEIIDGAKNSITLRLREMNGIIRLAGDLAVMEGSAVIDRKHVKEAIRKSVNLEERIHSEYGGWIESFTADHSVAKHHRGTEVF